MIGVVGGGIAGLSAAYRLQQRGFDVQVFEAAEDVGGLAATYETRGDRIEKFYHHLSKSERTIVDLAEDLGIGDRVEWHVGKNAYYVDGVSHPLDTPWEILAFPYLSLYDTVRLTMLTLEIDVRGGVPRFDTYRDIEDFEDVPVTDFLVEHTTPAVYEQFWAPLLEAKFGSRVEDVSAAWLLGRVKFRGERDLLRGEILGYFDGGFGVLLDALVEAVGRENITTGARVTDLTFDRVAVDGAAVDRAAGDGAAGDGAAGDGAAGDGAAGDGAAGDGAAGDGAAGDGAVRSLTVDTGDGTTTHDVEGVVVAAMPTVLESLTGYECDIDFQGTVCAVVAMDEPLLSTYWLNIADDAPFGVLIEHTNFVPPERYGGEHLLYVASYVQDYGETVWQLDDEAVRERWLAGIEDLFPQFSRADLRWMEVARNPTTAPIYERGYLDMVVPYDLSDAVADGVYYAGMASRAQYPERSLNGGVEAGFAAADAAAAALDGNAGPPVEGELGTDPAVESD